MTRLLRDRKTENASRELLFENVSCGGCGATDPKPFRSARDYQMGIPGIFKLVKCRQCGLVYQDPRPLYASIQDFYGPGYGPLTTHPGRRRRMEIYQQRIMDKISAPKLTGGGLSPRKLLDVGCGAGDLLRIARQLGWETAGVEPSGAVDLPEGALIAADLSDRKLEGKEFDVVVSHSLEHMTEPLRALARVRELMSGTGLLFVALPNIASIEARLFRSRWYHLDLPRHLYHFTPKTIRAMLRNAGFRVTRMQFLPWISLPQNLRNLVHPPRSPRLGPAHPRKQGLFDDPINALYAASLAVSDILGRVFPGEIMEVYARPNIAMD